MTRREPGLVVMRGDSCSVLGVLGSSPSTLYLWTFFTFICCKNWKAFLKGTKIKEKEAEDGPFLMDIHRAHHLTGWTKASVNCYPGFHAGRCSRPSPWPNRPLRIAATARSCHTIRVIRSIRIVRPISSRWMRSWSDPDRIVNGRISFQAAAADPLFLLDDPCRGLHVDLGQADGRERRRRERFCRRKSLRFPYEWGGRCYALVAVRVLR